MAESLPFDDLPPEEVHIEAVEAYHLGGTRYAASFELSDHDENYFRSYLLEVDCGSALTFRIRKQIEKTVMSHASLGEDRHLLLQIGGRMHDLTPAEDTVTFLPEGVLRRLFRLPGGAQYVVGDQGICYWREGSGAEWRLVPPLTDLALRAIHGPNADLIHACGDGGTLLHLQGGVWRRIDLPDDRSFKAIEVGPDRIIHLGGDSGTALALRGDELLELAAPRRDFFSIRSFKGHRYWADANWGLNRQEGDTIVPFRELRYAFYMHTSPEKLVISGWKEIFIFDGQNWDGFQLNYDGNINLTRLNMDEYGS